MLDAFVEIILDGAPAIHADAYFCYNKKGEGDKYCSSVSPASRTTIGSNLISLGDGKT